MFCFAVLVALVAVAVAEPEADPQYLVNPYVYTHPVVHKPYVYSLQTPVVQTPIITQTLIDPHHTEGMTVGGVPQKTDSVKLAEDFHMKAKQQADAFAKVKPYGYPYHYTTPYVYGYPQHVIAKREAEADPQHLYSAYHYPYTTNRFVGYNAYNTVPYTYTSAVAPTVTYPYTYTHPFAHHMGKREAEAAPQFYYNAYNAAPSTTTYGYPYHYGHPYHYGRFYGWKNLRQNAIAWINLNFRLTCFLHFNQIPFQIWH